MVLSWTDCETMDPDMYSSYMSGKRHPNSKSLLLVILHLLLLILVFFASICSHFTSLIILHLFLSRYASHFWWFCTFSSHFVTLWILFCETSGQGLFLHAISTFSPIQGNIPEICFAPQMNLPKNCSLLPAVYTDVLSH